MSLVQRQQSEISLVSPRVMEEVGSSGKSGLNQNKEKGRKTQTPAVWAPLSLNAVGEYKTYLPALGTGGYQQGRAPVWKSVAAS